MKHTGHKIESHYQGNLFVRTEYKPKDCKGCIEENRVRIEKEFNDRVDGLESSERENCDICGKIVGYFYNCDLSGGKIYCKRCKQGLNAELALKDVELVTIAEHE